MTGIFTSSTDQVLGIDDEETDRVLTALSATSARQILAALEDGPATTSELADETGLTPQNVSYHLGKLQDADLVTTDGTRGTGGQEATVYAAARSVVVSTETSADRRYRSNVAVLLVAAALTVACAHSLVGPSVTAFAMLLNGLLVPFPFL